jgi:ABC-2 type transport system ATP-binding protein
MTQVVLRAQNVEKSLGGTQVLGGIDLTVDAGETVTVLGPNGVGKSVLVSCLAGGTTPSGGTVEVLGEEPARTPGTTSFLLQDALCLDGLTGRENISFYARLNPSFTDRWRELVDLFEIGDQLEDPVEHYSGGMRRKLELAIALSVDAELYVLDEPTAALDLTTVREVHHQLSELRDAGKAVLVTTHLPMDADAADRIVFLTSDGVVTSGTPEAVRAEVPPVVETSLDNAPTITDGVVDGEVFRGNGVVRGLVRPGVDADALVSHLPSARVTEPTYSDIFNYYVNLDR